MFSGPPCIRIKRRMKILKYILIKFSSKKYSSPLQVEAHLFAVGGCRSDGTVLYSIERYNTDTDQWSSVGLMQVGTWIDHLLVAHVSQYY